MNLMYIKATGDDVELLAKTRVKVLRAANGMDDTVDMSAVEAHARAYYREALADGTHIAFLVFDGDSPIGAGGACFFKVLPTYYNPTGQKVYIMNMYTDPAYRRHGVAHHTLDLLVKEAQSRGITHITLEATDMGRPLYKKYGFSEMRDEMQLPYEHFSDIGR